MPWLVVRMPCSFKHTGKILKNCNKNPFEYHRADRNEEEFNHLSDFFFFTWHPKKEANSVEINLSSSGTQRWGHAWRHASLFSEREISVIPHKSKDHKHCGVYFSFSSKLFSIEEEMNWYLGTPYNEQIEALQCGKASPPCQDATYLASDCIHSCNLIILGYFFSFFSGNW